MKFMNKTDAMQKIEIIQPLILSDLKDNTILRVFSKNIVESFFIELNNYLTLTDDYNIVEYATERSLLSMALNGYCRQSGKKLGNDRSDYAFTLIQEYTMRLLNGSIGRPDCFFILKTEQEKLGFWIESKFDGFKRYDIQEEHWNKTRWKQWNAEILKQLMVYFKSELALSENALFKIYNELFLTTLSFKLIKEIPSQYFQLANSRLSNTQQNTNDIQKWFYSVCFLKPDDFDENSKSVGIEIYGNFTRVEDDN